MPKRKCLKRGRERVKGGPQSGQGELLIKGPYKREGTCGRLQGQGRLLQDGVAGHVCGSREETKGHIPNADLSCPPQAGHCCGLMAEGETPCRQLSALHGADFCLLWISGCRRTEPVLLPLFQASTMSNSSQSETCVCLCPQETTQPE